MADTLKDILYIITAIIGILGIFGGLYFGVIKAGMNRDKKIDENKNEIADLNTCQKDIKKSLDKIMENHLPHIQAKVDGIEKNVVKLQTIIEERIPRK